MAVNIVGLCGYAGGGKDTAAQGLIERGWTRVAFADPLKDLALEANPTIFVPGSSPAADERPKLRSYVKRVGWDEAKKIKDVREFLQNFGSALRGVDEDFWLNLAFRRIDAIPGDVVITDARFPNEFDKIRSRGGVLYRILGYVDGPPNGHESESFVANAPAHGEIWNTTTPRDLQETLVKMVKQRGIQFTPLTEVCK